MSTEEIVIVTAFITVASLVTIFMVIASIIDVYNNHKEKVKEKQQEEEKRLREIFRDEISSYESSIEQLISMIDAQDKKSQDK